MNRLDFHVMSIRNRLALGIFLEALAWAGMGLGAAILVAITAQRVLDRTLNHGGMLLAIGSAVTLLAAFVYSMIHRPTENAAAIKIDQVLGLKEKFSTALYARKLSDPFAQASVRDAESAAQQVSLYNQFPLKFPKQWFGTALIFLAALLVAEFMPPLQLFSRSLQAQNKPGISAAQAHSDQYVKQELPTILAPATMPSASDQIRRASDELNKAMQTDEGDELRSHRSLLSALQDYNKTMVDELKKNEQFQTAMEEQNEMAQAISNAKDDSTPMGKAQNELKSGDLDGAVNDISSAVDKFNKMSPADQQKMINQAMSLAQQLSNAANDPKTMQRVTQQLMQMGASQSQAQQMAATMQQAAQGNKQAQQQMQQMAKQMAQQMNNGQGPTQQQQQQMQQMMAKAQAMMNTQAQAQALSSAAQQLSQSMAQARSAQQRNANGQQTHPGQKPGSQSAGQQSMAQAQQNMQQQLQQMQANAKDAQAMQAAANAAADSAAADAAGMNGSNPGDSDGSDASGQTGQNPQPKGGGAGQQGGQNAWSQIPGKGGVKMGIAMAPASFKQQLDPSQDIQSGKILASRYVKAGIDPGKSTADMRDVAQSAQKEAPDDIDQDHVPREAQQAEKDYFSAMQQQNGN